MGRDLELDDKARQLERLYREFANRVRWVVRARGVPEASVDDAVHDVFLRVHRRLGERDPEITAAAWVDGIARNVAFSHRRSTARRAQRDASVPEPPAARTPHEDLERRDAWRRLREFLDALEDEQREAFILCEVLQTPAPEVARSTQVKLNTVYSRVRLARRRFEKTFGPDADERLPAAVREAAPSEDRQRRALAALVVQVGAAPKAAALTAAGIASAWKVSAAVAVVAVAGLGVARVATEPRNSKAAPAQVLAAASPTSPDVAASAKRPAANTIKRSPAPTPVSAAGTTRDVQPAGPTPTRRAEPPAPTPSGGPAAAPEDPLTAEVDLLEKARTALRKKDYAGALRGVDEHHSTFPNGVLVAQRHGIERAAACGAGDEARARIAAQALGAAPGTNACKRDPPVKKPTTDGSVRGAK